MLEVDNMEKIIGFLLIVVAIFFLIFGIVGKIGSDLVIVSGTENQPLLPLIEQFAKEKSVNIAVEYKGSVEIMQELQKEDTKYDAVWPANSLWISLGDTKKRIKHTKSIMTSPVVFGISKKKAKELDFIGKDVYIKDILTAIQEKKLRFLMTSATQSNSGASAYIGFLNAFLNNPEIITKENLQSTTLKNQLTEFLAGVDRSAGSSSYLKDLYKTGKYDAMVNYEALIIETNQELINQGKEPMYVVYPVDGLVTPDFPFAYINKGNKEKENLFRELQKYLLSENVQKQLLEMGRRTGFGGTIENANPQIFNPDWGIQADRILSPVKLPATEVIWEALRLYQTEFKKPSITFFVLDYSGSMEGDGEAQLEQAIYTILNQEEAEKHLLQASHDDEIVVIAFNDRVIHSWRALGENKEELNKIVEQVKELSADGGTDIYSPSIIALEEISKADLETHTPAIVLMTDGESNVGKNFSDFEQEFRKIKKDIPIYSIMFGGASEGQLNELSELTNGKVFDGRDDLINTFKQVKGYN